MLLVVLTYRQTSALWHLECIQASIQALLSNPTISLVPPEVASLYSISCPERGDSQAESDIATFVTCADTGETIVRYTLFDRRKDEAILIARILLMILFVLFGWSKLTGFPGAVALMVAEGAPLPTVAAIIAVAMEFFVGIAIVLGFYTRPLALLLAIYSLAAAVIGHHYWTMLGGNRITSMIDFYKNVSIMGGLLLLCVTGPGKYSIDRK